MSHTLLQDVLFNAKTVRALDRLATENTGISSFDLMQKAGAVALAELIETFGEPSFLHVFCGGGNNGGDGYIVAALAAASNISADYGELIDAEKIKAMLTSNGSRKKKNTVTDWMVCIPNEDSSSFPDNLLEVLEMIDGFSAEGLPMTMMILPTDYSFAYEMYHHQRHGTRKGIQTRKKLRKRQKNNSYDVDGCNSSCGDVRLAWHKHQQSWSPRNRNDLYSFVKVLIEIACDGFGRGSGGGATAISTAKMNNNEKGVQIK